MLLSYQNKTGKEYIFTINRPLSYNMVGPTISVILPPITRLANMAERVLPPPVPKKFPKNGLDLDLNR
jgi:hypothetical protein